MRAWVIGGLVLLLTTLAGIESARADPPLWRVRDADTEMVLFGSIHALPPGIDWRTAELDAALDGAGLVVFEVLTPGSEEEEIALLLPMMRYLLAPRPLSEAVSAETFARAAAAAEIQGLEIGELEMLRPWAAAIMLEVGADAARGRSDDLGVDTSIESTLLPDRRTEALDTEALLHAAMAALAEAGDAEGEKLLVEVLDYLDERGDELDMEIENAWLAGDLGPLLEELATMRAEQPRLHDVLLVDRNHGWMPALERMMATESRVVVIAGVLHMVGEDGLPALLRRAGYEVEGP